MKLDIAVKIPRPLGQILPEALWQFLYRARVGSICSTGPMPLWSFLFLGPNNIIQKWENLGPVNAVQGFGHHRYAIYY